jgi:hypothetical protein
MKPDRVPGPAPVDAAKNACNKKPAAHEGAAG